MVISIRLVPLRLLRTPSGRLRWFIRSPPIEAYLEEQHVPIVRTACFVNLYVIALEFYNLSASYEAGLVLWVTCCWPAQLQAAGKVIDGRIQSEYDDELAQADALELYSHESPMCK
jgi:hypothetical protein